MKSGPSATYLRIASRTMSGVMYSNSSPAPISQRALVRCRTGLLDLLAADDDHGIGDRRAAGSVDQRSADNGGNLLRPGGAGGDQKSGGQQAASDEPSDAH